MSLSTMKIQSCCIHRSVVGKKEELFMIAEQFLFFCACLFLLEHSLNLLQADFNVLDGIRV